MTTPPYRDDLGHPGPRDFENAIPRGDVLRATEPVVAPVATPPVGSGSTYVQERRVSGHPERRFSVGATFLGWACASFFSILFTGLLAFFVGGGALAADPVGPADPEAQNLAIGTAIGFLIAVFLSYLIGGYAAGRIALWRGGAHGAATVAWAVLFALAAFAFGAWAADATNLAFALPAGLAGIDLADVTTATVLGGLLLLATMLLGGWLGGKLGTRRHEEGAVHAGRRHVRGRPL